MAKVICPVCGASVEEGIKFCTECGATMAAGQGAQTSPNPEPVEQPQQPPVYQQPPQQNPQYQQPPQYQQNQQYQQPPQYQQVPPYQPPYINNPTQPDPDLEKPLGVGGWIGTMIVMSIPLVNIIMLFVWAFGSGNKGRRNYMRASLILSLIAIVITIVLVIVFYSTLVVIFNNMRI